MLIKLNKKSITRLKYELELISEWFYKLNNKTLANVDEVKLQKISNIINRYMTNDIDEELFIKIVELDFQLTIAMGNINNHGVYLMNLTHIKHILKDILELLERRI